MRTPREFIGFLHGGRRAALPPEYENEFNESILSINIRRETILTLIVIALNLIAFGMDAFITDFWTKNRNVYIKFGNIQIVLLAATAAFPFLLRLKHKLISYNSPLVRISHLAFYSFMLAFCSLSVAQYRCVGKRPLIYAAALFCTATLIILKCKEMCIINLPAFLIYVIVKSRIDYMFADLAAELLFVSLLITLACVVSHVNYVLNRKSFLARKTINEKNNEIKDLSTLLKTTFDNIPDMITVKNLDFELIYCNKSAARFYKWDENDRTPRKCYELLDRSKQCDNCPTKDVILKKRNMKIERYMHTNKRWMDLRSYPVFNEEGSVIRIIEHFRDITDRKNMEMEFKRSNSVLKTQQEENKRLLKEVMEYDELKNEFFLNISHEFRTPLNVLLGTLQLISLQQSRNAGQNRSIKQERYIQIMRHNCYRLLRLTNNLIDLTRLDSGFFDINLQNLNIVQIVEDITLAVSEYTVNSGLNIIFDTEIEEKVIAIDADKIERAILNLFSNAIKFTDRQGVINVNIRDKGEKVEISIKDTGIGIPKDKLDMIFERFRQVNSSLSRNSEGSGIGLSLAKHLVELHDGNIRAYSELNKGSEFIIELPCRVVCGNAASPDTIYHQNHSEKINIEFSDIYSA